MASLLRSGPARAGAGPYGPLDTVSPDANGILLPAGFSSRVVAVTGERPVASADPWHQFPDGGACFATEDGGWVYVSNSESIPGGVTALRFDPDGSISDAYPILTGTRRNCAGGPTPWGTWLSCEEVPDGLVWECDPYERGEGEQRSALGTFNHEAVAVDPEGGQLYLTEDEPDGLLYRFTPESYPDLTTGVLEAAVVTGDEVSWVQVPDPGASEGPTRHQVPDATAFRGGEGIWFDRAAVVFTTKGDNKVHAIDVSSQRYRVLYDAAEAGPQPPLTGVDNITAEPATGDIYVAEDGGNMELVLITAEGVVEPFLRITGHDGSEVTGPAFSPDGSRLYLSSQRGPGASGPGVTFEITGPFRGLEAPPTTTSIAATTALQKASEQARAGEGGGTSGSSLPLAGAAGAAVVAAAAAGVALARRGASRGSRGNQ